jgi:hypothetical protein
VISDDELKRIEKRHRREDWLDNALIWCVALALFFLAIAAFARMMIALG